MSAVPPAVAGRRPERPFDEPWQARAFALAVLTVEQSGGALRWDDFRDRLKAAIADQPGRPYWESWLAALEDLARLTP